MCGVNMNNLTLLTYTNSKVQDLHKPYFNRVKKYFPSLIHHLVISDILIPDVKTYLYKNEQPHFEQMYNALDNIKTEYVLYSQEDYILFDNVDTEKIQKCLNTLANNKDVSFIRLIQSGIENSIPINKHYLQLSADHQYFYSTQATIWKKYDLKSMFIHSKAQSIRDESQNSPFLKNLNKYGLCTTYKGKQIGNHFNSTIYPYIATAIVNGKWNCSEYNEELNILFNEFSINKNIRGTR